MKPVYSYYNTTREFAFVYPAIVTTLVPHMRTPPGRKDPQVTPGINWEYIALHTATQTPAN